MENSVFEYMHWNLYKLLQRKKCSESRLSDAKIHNWCFQMFQELANIHDQRYFYHDLKLGNILVNDHNVLVFVILQLFTKKFLGLRSL